MVINRIVVRQADGIYYLFDEYGQERAHIKLPADEQLLADFKTLELITKAIAYRWGLIGPKAKQ